MEKELFKMDDILKSKIDIIKLLSNNNNIFINNLNLFKNNLNYENKDILNYFNEEFTIFVKNIDKNDFTKYLCDELFKNKYKYVRSREDFYNKRNIIEVNFNKVVYIQEDYFNITSNNFPKLYNTNINNDPFLILPYIYYAYITPKINYLLWKDYLNIEKKCWEILLNDKKHKIKSNNSHLTNVNLYPFNEIFSLINNEKEYDYLYTGNYTFSKLNKENKVYDYIQIFHKNPEEFIEKYKDYFEYLTIKKNKSLFHFWEYEIDIYHKNELILNIIPYDYGMNFIRIGYENHSNYHGVLLILIKDYLKYNNIETKEKIFYLIENSNNLLNNNVFQNNIIGSTINPYLNFKLKEWNRELKFLYNPESDNKSENKSEINQK